GHNEVQFLVVLGTVVGDGPALVVPDPEAQLRQFPSAGARGVQVEGVALLGDLESAGRGGPMAGVAAALGVRRRPGVLLGVRRGPVRDRRLQALAHTVGRAERGGQGGGEGGDPQSGVHGRLSSGSAPVTRGRARLPPFEYIPPWGIASSRIADGSNTGRGYADQHGVRPVWIMRTVGTW